MANWQQVDGDYWELPEVGMVCLRQVLRAEGMVDRYVPYVFGKNDEDRPTPINKGWATLADAQADVEAFEAGRA